VRLPQEDKAELSPPTPGHVAAVHRLLPLGDARTVQTPVIPGR
jgi:hypothetical protein